MIRAEKGQNTCDLEKFVKVIAEKFGMGYDYAIKDRQGKPLKSWFTLQEALTAQMRLPQAISSLSPPRTASS